MKGLLRRFSTHGQKRRSSVTFAPSEDDGAQLFKDYTGTGKVQYLESVAVAGSDERDSRLCGLNTHGDSEDEIEADADAERYFDTQSKHLSNGQDDSPTGSEAQLPGSKFGGSFQSDPSTSTLHERTFQVIKVNR